MIHDAQLVVLKLEIAFLPLEHPPFLNRTAYCSLLFPHLSFVEQHTSVAVH
ncbi:hypothetical protein SAM19_05274 [Brevibacillus laterosporus]|nr:hypothetical protein [Brevibacillus laterosporus]